jgi:uncharacterized membrane protein YciS (DUF1049 family)
MRWLHILLIALFVAAIVVFAAQNLQIVTMTFLGFSATVPMAILAAIIYILGMATGGSLLSLVRWLIEGSKQKTTTAI